MKNIIFILIACLAVTFVSAQETPFPQMDVNSKRAQMVRRYVTASVASRKLSNSELTQENEYGNTRLFQAALEGDVSSLLKLSSLAGSGDFLLQKGKNGNNVFHVARNVETVQAVASLVRHFYDKKSGEVIRRLMNEKNDLGETPALMQLGYARAEVFLVLFKYTDQYDQMLDLKGRLAAGGLVADLAEGEKQDFIKSVTDASGRTMAQVALDNSSLPGMDRVIRFFEENAPYL